MSTLTSRDGFAIRFCVMSLFSQKEHGTVRGTRLHPTGLTWLEEGSKGALGSGHEPYNWVWPLSALTSGPTDTICPQVKATLVA